MSLTVLSSRHSIHRAYLQAIHRARSSVLTAAAYFSPDRRMVAASGRAPVAGLSRVGALHLGCSSETPQPDAGFQ